MSEVSCPLIVLLPSAELHVTVLMSLYNMQHHFVTGEHEDSHSGFSTLAMVCILDKPGRHAHIIHIGSFFQLK